VYRDNMGVWRLETVHWNTNPALLAGRTGPRAKDQTKLVTIIELCKADALYDRYRPRGQLPHQERVPGHVE